MEETPTKESISLFIENYTITTFYYSPFPDHEIQNCILTMQQVLLNQLKAVIEANGKQDPITHFNTCEGHNLDLEGYEGLKAALDLFLICDHKL